MMDQGLALDALRAQRSLERTSLPHAPPTYVLAAVSPDARNIVPAISSFLAARDCLITETQHYCDPCTGRSCTRVVFTTTKLQGGLEQTSLTFGHAVGDALQLCWSLDEVKQRCRVLVAVSQAGHCLNSMLHHSRTGNLPIEVAGVVSNHESLRASTEWHGVPFYFLPVDPRCRREQERRIIEVFEHARAELLVLARYMQVLSAEACEYFEQRAINIHHSFLPGFKGARAYHQAYMRGVKLIGATAHYVKPELDEGPIIDQEVARVDHSMSVSEFVGIGSDLESVVLNRAVKWYAERRLFADGTRVIVLR